MKAVSIKNRSTTNEKALEVLIVGAGPTGLTLAADLLRRGIRVQIIDQASGPSDKSKALGVQAGTLEALESTLGPAVSQRMINLGRPAKSTTIHIDRQTEIEVDLSVIQSHYNFILVLDQSLTEKTLTEEVMKYGGKIEWQTSLVGLQQNNDSVLCEISLPDGTKETVSTQYIVGCDGAHSKVRKILNVPFKGDQYEGEFILGDVQIDWPFSMNSIHVFLSEKGAMPCFPLNDKGLYRLIPIPKNKRPSDGDEINFEEFTRIARSLTHVDLKILKAQWLTRFCVHHRLSTKFSVGRVFLAGDAAHIHSPAGGQGMNTGIQDSLNLSHKFFQILRNGKATSLLSEYEKQRMPVAKSVLRGTDIAFRAALFREGFLSKLIRGKILPYFVQNKVIRNQVIQAISEVNIARREIVLRDKEDDKIKAIQRGHSSHYFIGEIILQSLINRAVLEPFKKYLILERTTEVQNFEPSHWSIHRYRMSEIEVARLISSLEDNFDKNQWYIHFYSENSNDMYVTLPGKTFRLPKHRDPSWNEMILYGESVGVGRRWTENIPVDFHEKDS